MEECMEKINNEELIDHKIWLEVDGMNSNRNIPYKSNENEKIEYYKPNQMTHAIISYRDSSLFQHHSLTTLKSHNITYSTNKNK
jgi:hypothetical protein